MKKKLLFIIILLLTFITIVPVNAKDKNFYANDIVTIDNDIEGTTFVAGNSININSQINGITFVAGNSISMNNNQDYAFIAGRNITLNEFQAKDAFIAGETIKLENANLRDLYVAGQTVEIKGNIENIHVGAETIIIEGNINGNADLSCENLEIRSTSIINGTLKYPEEANTRISKNSMITKVKKYKDVSINKEKNKTKEIIADITSWITSYLSILLVAIVLMLINKKFYDKVSKLDKTGKEIALLTLAGFIALIVIPIASIVVMLGVITIPLSIIILLLYGIFIYLSFIPTAYYIGNSLLKDKIKNKYLILSISLLGLYILKIIPVIGSLITFLSICFGLGIYYKLIKEKLFTK